MLRISTVDVNMNKELMNCPICGRKVEIRGGVEEWVPTFYDPDSGGDPYYIHCDCGFNFETGYCDVIEFINAWNTYIKNIANNR